MEGVEAWSLVVWLRGLGEETLQAKVSTLSEFDLVLILGLSEEPLVAEGELRKCQ